MLKNGNIDQSIVKLTSKLSLLPADSSLANLSDIISKTDILKKRYILKNVVEKLKKFTISTIYLLMYHLLLTLISLIMLFMQVITF